MTFSSASLGANPRGIPICANSGLSSGSLSPYPPPFGTHCLRHPFSFRTRQLSSTFRSRDPFNSFLLFIGVPRSRVSGRQPVRDACANIGGIDVRFQRDDAQPHSHPRCPPFPFFSHLGQFPMVAWFILPTRHFPRRPEAEAKFHLPIASLEVFPSFLDKIPRRPQLWPSLTSLFPCFPSPRKASWGSSL